MSRSRDFADLAGSADAGGLTGRNLIINGSQIVAQRGTSSASQTTGGYKTVDRFYHQISNFGTWTITQDSDVPSGQGFSKSTKWVCTTADASPATTDELIFYQTIEAQNLQLLNYGTSNAKSLTASFWVKSNKTGTYTIELYKPDGTAQQVSKTISVTSANTWEYKTVTFSGNTLNGIDDDNGIGLYFLIWLGSGSDFQSGTFSNGSWVSAVSANRVSSSQVNLGDSTSNYINITGVQLEVGTATPFEHEDYGTTLAKCQRYLRLGGAGVYGIYNSAANIEISIPFSPNMRAAPTLSMAKTSVTISNKTNSNTATATSVSATNISASPSGAFFAQIGNCNVTSAASGHLAQFRTDEFLQLDAEL